MLFHITVASKSLGVGVGVAPSRRISKRKLSVSVMNVSDGPADQDEVHTTALKDKDQQAVEDFVFCMNFPSEKSKAPSQRRMPGQATLASKMLSSESLRALFDTGLRRAIVGAKRLPKSIKVLGDEADLCLAELVPSVFSPSRLKVGGLREDCFC